MMTAKKVESTLPPDMHDASVTTHPTLSATSIEPYLAHEHTDRQREGEEKRRGGSRDTQTEGSGNDMKGRLRCGVVQGGGGMTAHQKPRPNVAYTTRPVFQNNRHT